jgi:hypothetical protein
MSRWSSAATPPEMPQNRARILKGCQKADPPWNPFLPPFLRLPPERVRSTVVKHFLARATTQTVKVEVVDKVFVQLG